MSKVDVAGGGPAGAAAALTALAEGASVTVWEKSAFPRHKVCGEFLSPELYPLLERLGLGGAFLALGPARVRSVRLHLGRRVKSWTLDEPAFGLSRYAFDQMLLDAAAARGAEVRREIAPPAADLVVAHGRRTGAEKGSRLFGFKAHFHGPCDDGLDLAFFGRAYAGVSAVENGAVNICGLAPESVLREHGFDPDRLLTTSSVLHDRLRGLERSIPWLVTGPLVFRDGFSERARAYPAGDALGFVDPFTGSGILSAVLTGTLAGRAAERGTDVAAHLRQCRDALGLQYRTAGLLRRLIVSGWAERLAALVPGRTLFEWTRPRIPV